MGTFLELEGKLGPIPQSSSNQFRPPQSDTKHNVRKVSKITEKRKRVAPTKKFKAKIAVEPNSNKATMQLPNTKALINTESQKSLNPLPESRSPPSEDAPIHAGTLWPKSGKMSGTLFKTRKDWLILPYYTNDSNISTDNTTGLKPPIKVEPKPKGQPTTSPKAENCGWGPNAPSAKTKKKTEMETTRDSCNNSYRPRYRWPNCSTLRPWTTKNPRAFRGLIQKHLMFLIGTQVSQNSVNNGKRKWRDSIANTV